MAGTEAALVGLHPSEMSRVPQPAHFAPLAPIDDIRGSAGYRRQVTEVIVRRLLEKALTMEVAA